MTTDSQASTGISSERSDCIQEFRLGLREHTRLLDALIAVLTGHESAGQLRSEVSSVAGSVAIVVAPMIQATGSSSDTLDFLSKAPGLQTRDCYSIARSIVEIAVNICFIIAEGEVAAERAARHARQKSWRDLNRESVIGDSIIRLFYDEAPDPSTRLRQEIDEFTAQSGREKSWIDLSVDERIARIGQKLGQSIVTSLHWARFAVYRHSSEILHGTFFGVLYFFGQTIPGRAGSSRESREFVAQQNLMIILSCVLAQSAIVESFHAAYGFSRAVQDSKRIVEGLRKLPYMQGRSGK